MSPKTRALSGFPELLPHQRQVELLILAALEQNFRLHGYISVETRAVEPVSLLRGQGEDADKEIYGLVRLADPGEPELGLHFDLTVPLSRYVLANAGHLNFPFKRYQIQKVWRGERPQEGRFREFTQADIDVVGDGELPPHYEGELPVILERVFTALEIPVLIRVNNRQIPEGFYLGLGITDVMGTLRAVDKLAKIGPERVRADLVGLGLDATQADQVLRLAQINGREEVLAQVEALGVQHPILSAGLQRLQEVLAANPGSAVVADLSVARGLDYYTGTVYEAYVRGHEGWGAVGGGGRYDSLASDGKRTFPGVGISVGVTRLVSLLLTHGGVEVTRAHPAVVLVAVPQEDSRRDSEAIATALRARGIAADVAPAAAKFGKQIRQAERWGIPYVWFPASGEGVDEVKDIRTGEQVRAERTTWEPPAADLYPRLRLAQFPTATS